jgi:hypothetical protein
MEGIESIGRVDLRWPGTGEADKVGELPGDMPTLGEVEALFLAWVREARRRNCPDSAPVAVYSAGGPSSPDLAVMWHAGLPRTTQGSAGDLEP